MANIKVYKKKLNVTKKQMGKIADRAFDDDFIKKELEWLAKH